MELQAYRAHPTRDKAHRVLARASTWASPTNPSNTAAERANQGLFAALGSAGGSDASPTGNASVSRSRLSAA